MADLGLYLGVFMINFVGAAIAVGFACLPLLNASLKSAIPLAGL